MTAWLYILSLKSGKLYIGATKDLKQRYKDHLASCACRTTAIDPPVGPVYSETFESFSEARRREAQLKRWTRAKKEALVSGETEKLRALSNNRPGSGCYCQEKPISCSSIKTQLGLCNKKRAGLTLALQKSECSRAKAPRVKP